MNWFKHDTGATQDAKIKKLLLKYGATGYAIYFHALELIAGDVTETNLTFELEHDSEIIADNLKIKGTPDKSSIAVVEEIMRYMVELGLFEASGDRIFCFKLLRRLDSSMTGSFKMRTIINKAKEHHDGIMTHHDGVMTDHDGVMTHHDGVMTHHDGVMREEKRREEIRKEENTQDIRARVKVPEPPKARIETDDIGAPHFACVMYWYKRLAQATATTVQPDERDNLAGRDLLASLGGDTALFNKLTDYFFDNWRDVWFAHEKDGRASFAFRRFAANAKELIPRIKPVRSAEPKSWSTAAPEKDEPLATPEQMAKLNSLLAGGFKRAANG